MTDQFDDDQVDPEDDGKLVINITAPERRELPRVFVDFLAEYGYEALSKWLHENDAPIEIIDLAEALRGLAVLQVENADTDLLGSTVAALARGLHFAGVELNSPGSVYPA